MLAGDSRGAWDKSLLDDPRVVSFWDGDRIAGHWFGDHPIGGLGAPGNVVWDAFYAFPKGAQWQQEPAPVIATGSDIISNTDQLAKDFIPLLR